MASISSCPRIFPTAGLMANKFYCWDGVQEGTGYRSDLAVGGTAVTLVDHEGPEIRIHFGRDNFSEGTMYRKPRVAFIISDSLSGVNVAAISDIRLR